MINLNILITGARSGIAKEVGTILLQKGHTLYLTTHTKKEAKKLQEELESFSNVHCFKLDVNDLNDHEKVKDLSLDVLINHAGIGIGGSIIDMPMELVEENFKTNVFNNFRLMQLVIQNMLKEGKKGKIFITSSLASLMPIPFLGSYCATKAAISMLATTLQMELWYLKSSVSISLIEPGAYHTGFNQVMIENKELWMREGNYFYHELHQLNAKEKKLFSLMEKKTLTSIVRKIVKNVEKRHPKRKIRAPFFQVLMLKLYLLLFK